MNISLKELERPLYGYLGIDSRYAGSTYVVQNALFSHFLTTPDFMIERLISIGIIYLLIDGSALI